MSPSLLHRGAVLVGLSLGLTACSLAPRYEAPSLTTVDAYKEAGDWLPAAAADMQPRGPWWSSFGDATLDDLQGRVVAGNQDLQAAVARLEQARALARGANSSLYPTLGAAASATRTRVSANAPTSAGVSVTRNDLVSGLDLSWEIDLLGRLRNEAAAARDRAEALDADRAALELALRAELATDYFTLRGADATQALLTQTVQLYARALEFTRNRHEAGIAAAADVDQAQAQLSSTQAQLSAVILQRAQLEHAIAVLLGLQPAHFSLPPAPLIGEPPPLVPGLPSQLLLRRPDVARAERAVAAANAEIGVARAAWFPVFTFHAGGGYEAMTGATWFAAPSRFWSAGPAVAVPLLDAGGRSSLTQRARAAYEEAAASYRQTALTAYREVEDNLVALRELADVQASEQAAAVAAKAAAYHADQRYMAGIADYIEVTVTQSTALEAQRAALTAQAQRLNAAVALISALGGGWGGPNAQGGVP
jgi:multidrug efflux system outer membrane protein